MSAQPKQKACASCGGLFKQWLSTQVVCSIPCGLNHVRAEKEAKAARKAVKAYKKKTETHASLVEKYQKAFNAFIRERDRYEGCISCGKPDTGQPNTFDAGHFYTVGAHPELRFDENNCHKQCKKCNHRLAGNVHNYRKALAERWGEAELGAIEMAFWQTPAKNYTHDELIEGAKTYRAKARMLKKKGAENE